MKLKTAILAAVICAACSASAKDKADTKAPAVVARPVMPAATPKARTFTAAQLQAAHEIGVLDARIEALQGQRAKLAAVLTDDAQTTAGSGK